MSYRNKKFEKPEYIKFKDTFKEYLCDTPWEFGEKKLLQFEITFGLSNRLADLDNCFKPFFDALQYTYGKDVFDDRYVDKIHAVRDCVAKGEEYISFLVTEFEE